MGGGDKGTEREIDRAWVDPAGVFPPSFPSVFSSVECVDGLPQFLVLPITVTLEPPGFHSLF